MRRRGGPGLAARGRSHPRFTVASARFYPLPVAKAYGEAGAPYAQVCSCPGLLMQKPHFGKMQSYACVRVSVKPAGGAARALPLFFLDRTQSSLYSTVSRRGGRVGRRRSPAKRVTGLKPCSRVQIPPSPPDILFFIEKSRPEMDGFLFFQPAGQVVVTPSTRPADNRGGMPAGQGKLEYSAKSR